MTRTTSQLLRDAGLRVTDQRLAVYDDVLRQPHAAAETIAAGARATLGSISTQAVYNVLDALVTAGLVRRIEPAGSPARFEARVGDNHHHIVCRRCGALADVDCAVGATPCLQPADDVGFAIDEAEVTFWGQCGDCLDPTAARATSSSAPPAPPQPAPAPAPADGGRP